MRQNVINDFNKASLNNTANLVPRVCLHCLPLSLGERLWLRLVTWPPVTQTFHRGKSQRIIFVDEVKNGDRCPSRAILNHTRAYTPLKFFRFALRFIQDKGYIFVWIQRIEISLWLQIQPVELLRSRIVLLLTAHCPLYNTMFYLPFCKIHV